MIASELKINLLWDDSHLNLFYLFVPVSEVLKKLEIF